MTPEQVMTRLIEWASENPQVIMAMLAFLLGGGEHYRRTGKFPIGRLPFHLLRQAALEVTTKYFRTGRPRNVPGFLVRTDQETFNQRMRMRCFESGDLYSYEYDGEVLNLRKPDGFVGEDVPAELHVRTFDTDIEGWIFIIAHHEASRFEAWGEHIKEKHYSWDEGSSRMKGHLQGAQFEYEEVESENKTGITITS